MNIFVFGCSWSDDRHVGNGVITSWVYEISKIMPEHNFYNFAYSGTSVHHSILMMETALKNFHVKPDKIIFQITNEGRVTFYKNQNFKDYNFYLEKISDNYFKFNIGKDQNYNNICCVNYGTLFPNNNYKHTHLKEIKEFAKSYYSTLTRDEHFDLEYKIQLDYLKNKVDFMFLHKMHCVSNNSLIEFNPNNDFLVVENLLPNNRTSFIIDEGLHFSLVGCIWEAKIIKDSLIKKWNLK